MSRGRGGGGGGGGGTPGAPRPHKEPGELYR